MTKYIDIVLLSLLRLSAIIVRTHTYDIHAHNTHTHSHTHTHTHTLARPLVDRPGVPLVKIQPVRTGMRCGEGTVNLKSSETSCQWPTLLLSSHHCLRKL